MTNADNRYSTAQLRQIPSLRVDIKSKGEDMSELTKVEITIVDGEWQWMGLLSKKSLKLLTQMADTMSDNDTTTK